MLLVAASAEHGVSRERDDGMLRGGDDGTDNIETMPEGRMLLSQT